MRAVRRHGDRLAVHSDAGTWHARFVVSATGTWWRPYVPHYPGMRDFRGEHLHTAGYRGPEPFRDRRVVIVGGGNSAAQILAELSQVAETTWVTLRPPRLLPDELDTRALAEPRLHLLGYGDWTGPAPATLIGAGRTARQLAAEIAARLRLD